MVVTEPLSKDTAAAVKRTTELILGPYRAGKTTLLLNQLLDYCAAHPMSEALVLVPSHRYKALLEQRLQKVFLERNTKRAAKGFVGVKILTFQALCETVLRRAGVPFKVVPKSIRPVLVSRAMARLNAEGKLKYIDGMIGFSGTHQASLELIDEFERAALTPSDVIRRLEKTSCSDSKYMELAQIYEGYVQELNSTGYIDEKYICLNAREFLYSNDFDWNIGFLAVDGFDRFNPLQLQVLKGLSKYCSQLKVCFDYKPPADDIDQEYVWKESSFDELSKTFPGRIRVRNITGFAKAEPSCIKKLRAVDRQFEMENIAKEVKCGLVSGKSASDYIVVVRNVKPYRSAIATAFESAGIPYFIDESIGLSALPLVRLIMTLLKLSHNQFPRRQVIESLASPYFNRKQHGLSSRELEFLDRASIKVNVVSGAEHWHDIWTANEEDDQDDVPDERFSETQAKLFAFFEKIQPPPYLTNNQFVLWAEDVIQSCIRDIKPTADRDPFDVNEEQRALGEFRKSLAALLYEESIIGAQLTSAQTGITRLEHLVDRSNFRKMPRFANSVVVSGADLAPNMLVDHVFVAGLVDGEFPKRTARHGFISMDEVSRWASFGVDINNPRFHPAFENALFQSLLKRAKSGVHLSFPMSDIGGEELTPSFFITEGKSDYEESCRTTEPFHDATLLPVSPRDYLSGLAWTNGMHLLQGVFAKHPSIEVLAERLSAPFSVAIARGYGQTASSYNGYLCDFVSTNAITVRLPEKWSASRLTDYGKCPFRFWVTHVLKATPHEEPEVELSAKVLGETYHKAMELFYSELNQRGIRMRPASLEVSRQIFESSMDGALGLLERQKHIRRGEFWDYNRSEIKFRLRRFFEFEYNAAQSDNDGYEPAYVEANFGFDEVGSFPPLIIDSAFGAISIRGKIDRIDLASGESGKQARIIDYKKGTSFVSDEEVKAGRNFQLPLYALAVEQSILPGVKVSEAKYLSISSAKPIGTHFLDGRKKRTQKADEPVPDFRELTRNHIVRIVESIASGDFGVAPNGANVCNVCDHKAVCRVREMRANKEDGADECLD